MRAKLVPIELWHLLAINIRKEQRCFIDQFDTDYKKMLYFQHVTELAAINKDNERVAYSVLLGDTVVGCGGIVSQVRGQGEAWTLLSEDFPKKSLTAVRAIRKYLHSTDLVRIQATADFEDAAKFLEFLGFTYEATLEKASPKFTDQLLYKIVR